jgi:hypothetical protein
VGAFRGRFELPAPEESREAIQRAIEESRRFLGEQHFEDAWSPGCALPLDDAIDLALSVSEEGVSVV